MLNAEALAGIGNHHHPIPHRALPGVARPGRWPELGADAMHGIAGEIVNAATEESEADPAAVLATLLTMVGTAIGRGPFLRVSDDEHHARLFCVLVGQSARGRKGTSEGPIRRVWSVCERTLEPLAWKPGPMSSGEGLVNAIRDGSGEDDEGVPDKRLLIVESEFAAPLRAMRREGNTLSATLRTAWDGKTLEPLTKQTPIKASRPHVGIVAHVTETELRSLLGQVEIFNGFANRFLWWGVRRVRLVPLARGMSDAAVERLGMRLAAAIGTAQQFGQMCLHPKARALYEAEYETLSADQSGLFGAATTRAEVQVIRLAMIYALLDAATEIDTCHLMAALAVWNYCDASAARLFGEASLSPLAWTSPTRDAHRGSGSDKVVLRERLDLRWR